ncbi:MAG: tetratricopeptide repeat protein [Erythrobacter sp.]
MDRSITIGRLIAPRLALALTTALAGLTLTGCAGSEAPRANMSVAGAQNALAQGKFDRAIENAEAGVLAEPRNAGYRALLAASYLKAGRFQSAATTFNDAVELGDTSPRTVLSFALAKIAIGDGAGAMDLLDDYAQDLDPADLGLALALAGQPERGVHVLFNAVRESDEASPKLRQNLAYAYALAGNWRAARVMAAEDVPADQLDARLAQWAEQSAPGQFQQRIAALINVTPRADDGQPQRLALANFPAQDVMVAEAAEQARVDYAYAEPVKVADPAPSPTFSAAFAAPEPAADTAQPASMPMDEGARFVSNPVVQSVPAGLAPRPAPVPAAVRPALAARRVAAAPAPRAVAAQAAASAPVAQGPSTHFVQLGSYSTKLEATRGWAALQSQFPQLKGRAPVITEAVVNGRTFWRVAAEGFNAQSAKAMCGTLKSAGRGCFAYAASTPPAGVVNRNVQVASRNR